MIGTILAVLGIVLTIGFGIYSIWQTKRNKKNVSLEFNNEECYSLFRDDINRLNIFLSYDKKPITNTLILLKAKLTNNGQSDIDKTSIYKPLKIITNKEFKWLEVNITSSPNGAAIKSEIINENEVEVIWDLLKKNESIEIEALAETLNDEIGEKANEFYEKLKFDYRITDLNKVQKEKKLSSGTKLQFFVGKFSIIFALATIIFGATSIILSYNPEYTFFPQKQNVNFTLNNDSTSFVGEIDSNYRDELILKPLDSDEEINLSISEFNQNYKIENIRSSNLNSEDAQLMLFIGIAYLIMGLVLLFKKPFKKLKRLFK